MLRPACNDHTRRRRRQRHRGRPVAARQQCAAKMMLLLALRTDPFLTPKILKLKRARISNCNMTRLFGPVLGGNVDGDTCSTSSSSGFKSSRHHLHATAATTRADFACPHHFFLCTGHRLPPVRTGRWRTSAHWMRCPTPQCAMPLSACMPL